MFQTPVSDMLLWIGAGELLVIRCITAVKSGVNRPVAIKQEATVLYSSETRTKKSWNFTSSEAPKARLQSKHQARPDWGRSGRAMHVR